MGSKKSGTPKSKAPTRRAVIAPVVIPASEDGAGFWSRVDNWSERLVVRLEEMGAAPHLRVALTAAVTLLPFLVGFSVVQEWVTSKVVVALLAAAYLALSFGATELQRHRNAGKQRRQATEFEEAMDGISRACGSLGGSIGSLSEALFTGDRQLDENECRYFCVGLLARIRTITREVLPDAKHVRLRATLAVPIFETGGNDPDYLRVWCYDETHGDRRWTKLPIAWPGAPAAYLSGQPTVIDDIRKLRYVPDAAGRTFRSVISIPVVAGVTGRTLASRFRRGTGRSHMSSGSETQGADRVEFIKTDSGWSMRFTDPNPETRFIPPRLSDARRAVEAARQRAERDGRGR